MKKTEQFCQEILAKIGTKSPKAFTNTVLSLSSYESGGSVTELSESPLFHHQYSSLRDGIAGIGEDESSQSAAMLRVRELGLNQLSLSGRNRVLLQTDASSVLKAHSSCLADRQYVKINNNVIRKNQPISVGYPISLVNISPGVGKWSIPLDIRRIPSVQSATQCAVEQIGELLQTPPLSELLVINTLDSGYGNATYMSEVYEHENLVNLVRFRHGKKVWLPAQDACQLSQDSQEGAKKKQGAPSVYGQQFYLIEQSDIKTYKRKGITYEVARSSIFGNLAQEHIELEGTTSKGRELSIQVWRWNDLLIRTKDGHDMKDKPFDLIASQVRDKNTGDLVFNKTMFTAIHGQKKAQISTKEAFEGYRKRYDIEPAIKFAKQKLLLDKYQTPKQQHFDNWLVVVVMAFWVLFTAKDEVNYTPKKWRTYKEKHIAANSQPTAKQEQEQTVCLTPSQVRQAAQDFFLTFESTPFLPKTTNKGKGREKSTKITPRARYPVVKKVTNKTKKKRKIEKRE